MRRRIRIATAIGAVAGAAGGAWFAVTAVGAPPPSFLGITAVVVVGAAVCAVFAGELWRIVEGSGRQ